MPRKSDRISRDRPNAPQGGIHVAASHSFEYVSRPALLPESLRGLILAPKAIQQDGEIVPVSADQLCDPTFCGGLSFQRYRRLLGAMQHEIDRHKKEGKVPDTQWTLGTTPVGEDWLDEGKYKRLWLSLGLPTRAEDVFPKPPGALLAYPRVSSHRLLQLVRAIEAKYGRAALERRTAGGIRRRVAALANGPLRSLRFSDARFGGALIDAFPKREKRKPAECFIEWAATQDPVADPSRIALLEQLEVAADSSFTAELEAIVRKGAETRFEGDHHRLRNVQIAVQRYSATEEEGNTLQAIGNRFGMTRERVRQITDKIAQELGQYDLWLPACDRALAALRSLVPVTIEGAARSPELHRALGPKVSVRAFLRFCNTHLGPQGLHVGTPQGLEWRYVVDEDDVFRRAVVVRSAAVKLCSHYGAAHLSALTWLANEMGGYNMTSGQVERIAEADLRFEWLDRLSMWGWLGPEQATRIRNHVFKVLAVARRRVDIETIYGGIVRNRHHGQGEVRGMPFPSPPIVAEMIRRMPEVQLVQYDDFQLRQPDQFAAERFVADVELPIYNLAKANDGVFTRRAARDLIVLQMGYSEGALHHLLEWSPIFQPLGDGVYCLRGWQVSGDALAEARKQIAESRRAAPQRASPPRPPAETIRGDSAAFDITLGRSIDTSGQHAVSREIADWILRRGIKAFEVVGQEGRHLRFTLLPDRRTMTGLQPLKRVLGLAEGQTWSIQLRDDGTCTLEPTPRENGDTAQSAAQ